MIEISAGARVSRLADIEDSVQGTSIVIADGVTIDAFVKIKPVGGAGDVVIGPNSFINSGCVLYSGNGISIGANVLIAANCTIVGSEHEYRSKNRPIHAQRFSPGAGGVIIGDDVWIGANCVVLEGAILREGCVIGAGSLVRGEVAAYSVNVGNPLRQIGMRT